VAAASLWSPDEETTRRVGAAVARHAGPSSVIALLGDLGAGKTRLVEGAARALGYGGRVRSPTFTLMNVYRGRLTVYHFDLYRLCAVDEREFDEWTEVWESGGVSFIEWADRLDGTGLEKALTVRISHEGGDLRRIVLEGPEGVWGGLLSSLEDGPVDAYPRA
jgi:tRNA threonylcarbamoyladenosine biosynthesis protein TsaE